MRQQFLDPAVRVRRQARENIFQIGVRIVPIELGRLDQAHHGGSALARTQGSGEQPVFSSKGHRPDLLLDVVVVNGHAAIVQVACERSPAFQAVVQGFGRAGTIGHTHSLGQHPGVQLIGKRLGLFLSYAPSLGRVQCLGFTLDFVELADITKCLLSKLALVGGVQLEELATSMGHTPDFRDAVRKSLFIAAEVVYDQLAVPVTEEVARMRTGTAWREVLDDGVEIVERARRIGP